MFHHNMTYSYLHIIINECYNHLFAVVCHVGTGWDFLHVISRMFTKNSFISVDAFAIWLYNIRLRISNPLSHMKTAISKDLNQSTLKWNPKGLQNRELEIKCLKKNRRLEKYTEKNWHVILFFFLVIFQISSHENLLPYEQKKRFHSKF